MENKNRRRSAGISAEINIEFSLLYPAKSKLCVSYNFAEAAGAKSLAIYNDEGDTAE